MIRHFTFHKVFQWILPPILNMNAAKVNILYIFPSQETTVEKLMTLPLQNGYTL
jgi:uncharacterized membrane protein